MAEDILNTNNYQFEPVHIDWTGTRTQMIIGLLAIFCLCLVNFIHFWQGNFFSLSYLNFTLYFFSCSIVALIALEISGASGNRNGAGCAIWSALIFAVFPWQGIACSPVYSVDQIIIVLVLLFFLLLLRTKRKGLSGLALLIGAVAFYISACFQRNLLYAIFPNSLSGQSIVYAYILSGLILCGRLFTRAISWQTAFKILICFGIALIGASSVLLFPGVIVISAAILAIILCLTCLPGIEAAPARINQLYGSLGLIALVTIAVAYEQRFIDMVLCIR